MPLHFAFFALRSALAENVLVLGVGLGKVGETEALIEFQIAAAFRITANNQVDAPFNFGGRALAAAAEEHIVFDF